MTADAAFVVPRSVEEAIAALGTPGAVALAGGTSVGLLIGQGLLDPAAVVWLGRIEALRRVERRDGRLVIGAGVTLRELAAHPEVAEAVPAMAAAAGVVGNTRVRAVATVGGALAHADPRQDLPPACIAHRAEVTIAGPTGRRTVPVEDFATGFMSTVLGPDEIVTDISVPVVPGLRSAYLRFTPGSADDYPTVGVAATLVVVDGTIDSATMAVAGAGPRAYAVPEAGALAGIGDVPAAGGTVATSVAAAVAAVARAAAERAEPVDDRLGSARYKRAMVAVWARRAVEACLGTSVNVPPVR